MLDAYHAFFTSPVTQPAATGAAFRADVASSHQANSRNAQRRGERAKRRIACFSVEKLKICSGSCQEKKNKCSWRHKSTRLATPPIGRRCPAPRPQRKPAVVTLR